jgi:putative transposase
MSRRNDCLPPGQIVPRLADEGEYVASESTFYRILLRKPRSNIIVGAVARPAGEPPRLCARAPCEVWTWDISWLAFAGQGAVSLPLSDR